MAIKIRESTLDDVQEVRRLVHSLRYYYLINPENHLPDWFNETLTFDAFNERFLSDEFASFIYEKSGNIHGYIALKKPNQIYHLYVSESVHNRGVGKRLWQHAYETLGLESEPVIYLNSSLGAVKFYEKLGFVSTEKAIEKDNVYYQPMQFQQKVAVKDS